MSPKDTQKKVAQPILDPKDLYFSELIKGGFARGVEGLKGTALDLVPALAASSFGNDAYAKQQLDEYAQRMAALEEEHPTAYRSFRDIKDVNDAFGYGAETFGELGPDMISFLLGAGVGSTAGKAVAKKGLEKALEEHAAEYAARKGLSEEAAAEHLSKLKSRATEGALHTQALEHGARIGELTGLGAASAGMNIPDTFNQIYQDTGKIEPGLALTVGSVVGLLDVVGPERFIRQLKPAEKEIVANALVQKSDIVPTTWKREFGKEVAKNAALEGITEGAQQALQNYGSDLASGKHEFLNQHNIDSIIDASIRGALGGSLFGMPGAAFESSRIKKQREAEIAQQQQQRALAQAAQEAIAGAQAPQLPPPVGYQSEMFPTAQQQRPDFELSGQPPVPQPPAPPEAPAPTQLGLPFEQQPQQMGLPLVGGMTGPQVAMAEQIGQQNQAAVEAAQKTAEQRKAEAAKRAEEAQVQLDEAIKRKDEMVAHTEAEKSQKARLDILHGILDNPEVVNVEEKFKADLKRAGYRDTELTEAERHILNKVEDIKAAIADYNAVEEEPSTPSELTPEITGIKEKPGLTSEKLAATGLKENSGIFKQLVNKDPANPNDAEAIAKSVKALDKNKLISDDVKTAVKELVAKGAESGRTGLEPVSKTDRAGLSVSGQPTTPEGTEGVTEPERAAVADVGKPAPKPRIGTREQPVTLTPKVNDAVEALKNIPVQQPVQVAPVEQAPVTKVKKPRAAKAAEAVEEKPRKLTRAETEGTQEWRDLARPGEVPFDVSKGYQSFVAEDIPNMDDQLRVRYDLLQGKPATPEEKAAQVYFGKMKRIVDNLLNIGFDLAFDTPQFSHVGGEADVEAAFFKGMSGKQARLASKWVYENLSAETGRMLRDFTRSFEIARDTVNDAQFMDLVRDGIEGIKESRTDSTVQDYIDAMEAEAKAPEGGPAHPVRIMMHKILSSAVNRMAQVLHPRIIQELQRGDLNSALRFLAASESGYLAKIADKYTNVIGDTKIEMRDDLHDAGVKVPGYFDPMTNTIYLDSVTGINSHVLLHEVGHALTSHELDNPESQLGRQLSQLLDDIKDSLDSAYGATSVHEFAAEAKSNPEFRETLRSIHPNGGKYSAWDKFTRAIGNFIRKILGMPPKPLASALDEADRIIDMLISPAPESRNGGLLRASNSEKGKEIFNGVDKFIRNTPYLGESQKAALSEGIKRSGGLIKSSLLSLLPMHALGDVADTVFPGLGKKFNNAIHERDGYRNKLSKGIDAVVHEAKNAIKVAPQQQEEFNKIVNESTVYEVDPTKKITDYKEPEDIEKYKELRARYNKLNKVWQDQYVTMRNAYKQMYEELKDSIKARIDETELDKDAKEKVKANIMAKLASKGMIEPYFALGREGTYWLAYNYRTKSGGIERAQEAFKTEYERKLRMEEVRKMQKQAGLDENVVQMEPYSKVESMNYQNAPAGSFASDVLGILQTNDVPEKAIEDVMHLFLTTLPETAAAKAFMKRKNIEGYKEDTIGVFERKMRSMSHQVANMRYNPKLTSVVREMEEFANLSAKYTGEDNQNIVAYVNEYKKHLSYVLNPKPNDLGGILNSAAFAYTLGFNVSSAIVNAANIPMIVAPYLKGKYNAASVTRAIGDASKVFLGSGTSTEMEVLGAGGRKTKMKVMPSLGNYAPDSAMGKKYATLINVANKLGQLNRSQLYEILQGDTRTGTLGKINAASGWVMHHGERMNREVTMIAAYDLEMQKLAADIKSGKITREAAENQAANNAIYVTELTNGGISAASAPRISQHPLGKLFFMYKRYGISMYYMMIKTAKEAFNQHLSPEERKAAWNQLKGIFGMSALMAGVGGIPFFGALSLLFSMFNDDDDDDLDTATRKYLGEFMYKGPLEYMTNLSIASRISLNDLIVRDTKGGSGASTFKDQLIQIMGGPAYGVADRITRGYSMMNEGHFERGLENMLPASISNLVLKAPRYAIEGTSTLRGDPITGDVNAWNITAQALGFAPADYIRQTEINAKEKGVDKYVNEKASQLRKRWNAARTFGDTDGMQEARDGLLELGAKHKGLGINAGTINQDLEKSKKQYDRATKEMVHGVRYSKKMRAELLQDSAEYGDE